MTALFGHKPSVLVVDDNEVVLDIARAALESAGFVVTTRARSEGTIAAILQEKPDLVLLDVSMPHTNGDTIASIVARASPARKTILVLHSSLAPELLKLKVLQTGAHGYIQKTGNTTDFVNQVNHWLKSGSARSAPRSFSIVSRPTAESSTPNEPVASSRLDTGEPVASASAPPPTAVSGELQLSLPKTLLVDHDRAVLAEYERALKLEPLISKFAQSSDRALESILSSNPPDVVVCDVSMPRISGMEIFGRAVSRDPTWAHRFVFVTDEEVTKEVADFLRSVEARVLQKPVEIERLVRAVRYSALAARVFRDGKAARR
jgi:DNA-binding NarL/FixJ family response regulator